MSSDAFRSTPPGSLDDEAVRAFLGELPDGWVVTTNGDQSYSVVRAGRVLLSIAHEARGEWSLKPGPVSMRAYRDRATDRESLVRLATPLLQLPPTGGRAVEPSIASPKGDEIARLRIGGFRVVDALDLELRGLTVLIGENGAGKSTVLEALDLLRLAASPRSFVLESLPIHGPVPDLSRDGRLSLGVRIEGAEGVPPIDYGFTVRTLAGGVTYIEEEHLDVFADPSKPEPLHAIVRHGGTSKWFDRGINSLSDIALPNSHLMLTAFGRLAQPAVARVLDVLGRIQVRAPSDVRKSYTGQLGAARRPNELVEAREVEQGGANLANAIFTLQQQGGAAWDEFLDRARVAFDIVDIKTPAFQRGGIDLAFQYRDRTVRASQLSDGQLAYLSILATAGLRQGGLLALDEPETHLHPALLQRLVWLLESEAEKGPVVVATQSDGLLDALSDPAAQVVLCSRGPTDTIKIERPERQRLAKWLEQYRGLGAVRADGHERLVFDEEPA